MLFKTLKGRQINKNISKYLVNWDLQQKKGKNWGKFQFQVKQFFKEFWEHNVVCEELPCWGTGGGGRRNLRLDFFNASRNIAVEVNGAQHNEMNEFFHGDHYGFLDQIKRDTVKCDWCVINDINLIYITSCEDLSVKYIKENYQIIL